MKYTMVFLIDSGHTYAIYRKPEGVVNWELTVYAQGGEIRVGGVTVYALLEKLRCFRKVGYEVQHFLEVA